MTRPVRHRRTTGAFTGLAALLGALALGGCGIRPTQVPVDAGPAPSRVPCEVSGDNLSAQPQGVPVRIYLVCASQLSLVDRTADIPAAKSPADGLRVAQALLAELQKEPSSAEREAGFATYVRGGMSVSGGRASDPPGTLRLSRQPEDLPAAALSQIVCTFAESRAASAGVVVLGGPGAYAPRAYECTGTTRERPAEPVPTLALSASPSPSA
ncbi:hypothetical protein ACFYT4_10975 [Streptomyces sp. NPDC004609]|uniref:hypothetical protein n=1 Tax=Streptomyces sp. NPDC004609 TaxID=3364704 RepID=UPI0036A720DE